MFSVTSFDELNSLVGYKRSMPYEKYFGEMQLSDEEKQRRIELANRIEDELIYVVALMFETIQNGNIDYQYIQTQVEDAYTQALMGIIVIDSYIRDYISDYSEEFVNATMHHEDDMYYFSKDRVISNSENESNTIYNRQDYNDAVKIGKTRKQWHTTIDGKERESHRILNGTVKNIHEPFCVCGSIMDYPKDTKYGASSDEIVNCRCSVTYF